MKYYKELFLQNGKKLILRQAGKEDAEAVIDIFIKTHEETDYLAAYVDEFTSTIEQEEEFLAGQEASPRDIQILAITDDAIVGLAGIGGIGPKFKVSHRAELGISIIKDYWGQGIGKSMMHACIESAREAEYEQLELSVVEENDRAIDMYKRFGFVEIGRNPKGFRSRYTGYQTLLTMALEL